MNIRLVNITRDGTHIEDIKRLYLSAFPEDERAPFRRLIKNARKRNINFFACMDGDEWVGFVYVINRRDLSYIFYLAVDEQKRGQGLGTAILKAVLKKYAGRRVFLAIERLDERADNYPQRLRRYEFYCRAGFSLLGQRLQEANVIYDLLGVGGAVGKEEYHELIKSFAGVYMLIYPMRIL